MIGIRLDDHTSHYSPLFFYESAVERPVGFSYVTTNE